MTNKVTIAGVVIAIVIAVIALMFSMNVSAPLPGGTTNFDDLTLKANPAATTTLSLLGNGTTLGGCIQIQPTSTATTLSSRVSLLGATSTFAATMYFSYGTCK